MESLFQETLKYSNINHIQFIKNRKKGISIIKLVSHLLVSPPKIVYKAIFYLDLIFLNNKLPLALIEDFSIICLRFAYLFNDTHTLIPYYQLNSLIKGIKDYSAKEVLCLKSLDYNLIQFSAYDLYIEELEQNKNLSSSLKEEYKEKLLHYYELFVEDDRWLDFDQKTICKCLLHLVISHCEGYQKNENLSEGYLHVNVQEGLCRFVFSIIGNCDKIKRTLSISSCSTNEC